jgi:hypothetical protein
MNSMQLDEEAGFTSLQFAVMAFFSMLIFAVVLNAVTIQYQLGAVRVAVDEGARYGAAAGALTADCEQRVGSILYGDSGLLRGSLGDGITVSCWEVGGEMVASARGVSPWWMGGLADGEFTIEGRAVIETFAEAP